jgi:putative endonuclease
MNGNKRKGLQYESLAKQHLQRQGLKFFQQNYHSRFGEIDLIMLEADTVCFIEVKFRKSQDFGGAANAIPYSKRQKIIKTAQIFMSENQKLARRAMRFDALILQQIDQDININWIQNAFYAE